MAIIVIIDMENIIKTNIVIFLNCLLPIAHCLLIAPNAQQYTKLFAGPWPRACQIICFLCLLQHLLRL